MRSKLYFLLIYFVISNCFSSFGQNQKQIDSLKVLISKLPDDTIKIQSINELANILVDIEPEKTIEYCKEALRIAEKKRITILPSFSCKQYRKRILQPCKF